MGKQVPQSDTLAERFLHHLRVEEAELVADNKRADAAKVERDKRLRQIRREIETIKGGAI